VDVVRRVTSDDLVAGLKLRRAPPSNRARIAVPAERAARDRSDPQGLRPSIGVTCALAHVPQGQVEGRRVNDEDAPDDLVVDALLFVTEHIPHPGDLAPPDLRLNCPQLPREATTGLRKDLQLAFDRAPYRS
jgi:hypothetical protein